MNREPGTENRDAAGRASCAPVSLRSRLAGGLFLALVLPALCFSARAQTVDQILMIVNQGIITRSDLIWSMALDPKAPNPAGGVSPDLLRQKLDVMIDQRLIEGEARQVPGAPITQEEVD